MKNINQVISEEIDKYIDNIITEKKASRRRRKKGYKKDTGANLNTQDNANMSHFLPNKENTILPGTRMCLMFLKGL